MFPFSNSTFDFNSFQLKKLKERIQYDFEQAGERKFSGEQ